MPNEVKDFEEGSEQSEDDNILAFKQSKQNTSNYRADLAQMGNFYDED